MAARQTNSRSSNKQTSAAKKRTTQSQAGNKNSGKRSRSSTTSGKRPKMTKEEIAEQSAFHDEIILVITLVVSILLVLANFGMGGFVGEIVNKLFFGIFGSMAYLVPVAIFVAVAFHISNRGNWKATKKIITGTVLMITLMAFFQMLTKQYDLKLTEYYGYAVNHKLLSGGFTGGLVCTLLLPLFGQVGTYVIIIAIFLICFMMFTGKTILTAISRRGEQSLHEMRERHRESASLRQEYRQQLIEESESRNEAEREAQKRKAKIFTLKKKNYEIDEETGEIKGDPCNEVPAMSLATDTTTNADKSATGNGLKEGKNRDKRGKDVRTAVDMAEIQPNFDHLPISGSYVSNGEVSTYEDELNEKFGKQTYGQQAESIEFNLGNQVATMMDESGARESTMESSSLQSANISDSNSGEAQGSEHSATKAQEGLAEPAREARIHVQEVTSTHEAALGYESVGIQETDQSLGSDDSIEIDASSVYCIDAVEGEANSNHSMRSNDSYVTEGRSSAGQAGDLPTSDRNRHGSNHPSASNGHAVASSEGGVTTEDIAMEIQKAEEKPYVFPPMDLLAKPKKNVKGMTEHDLKETAAKLQKTLESFGVRATITNVTCGPAVTRYEIQPEQGVKVSTITKLSDDIKLNLAATDIRIEAPIPGKAAVGIEVPNKENAAVMFRELIENKDFAEHPSDLAFAVGKDIGGQSIITDIAKMPHLLIAGATGSGKSVCINTLIMSILYKADPKDVKLIMVDPKVVELSIYNGIPHLMIPVVTDPKKASAALNWAVVEMNDRYKRFADLGVRDVKSYNAKIKQVEYLNDERYKKMPQIVIIVDELADLMMVAKGEVEEAICRLAQMARAAGLHLVIATQRPSVNVITGLIKANVPSRIAFAVSSAIDSRTIIDGSGAEKLLGKGDMLFFPQGYPKPVRLQGAFISDKEVSAVVDFLSKENGTATYSEDVAEHISSGTASEVAMKSGNDLDDYFVQAGKFIIEKDKASIGMLQRVYKIGFNRAARIMDQLCEAGVVGPEEGTKPRKVLMSMEEFDQYVEECV